MKIVEKLREGSHGDMIVSVQWQSQLSHRGTYTQGSHDPLAWRRQCSGWQRFVSVLEKQICYLVERRYHSIPLSLYYHHLFSFLAWNEWMCAWLDFFKLLINLNLVFWEIRRTLLFCSSNKSSFLLKLCVSLGFFLVSSSPACIFSHLSHCINNLTNLHFKL